MQWWLQSTLHPFWLVLLSDWCIVLHTHTHTHTQNYHDGAEQLKPLTGGGLLTFIKIMFYSELWHVPKLCGGLSPCQFLISSMNSATVAAISYYFSVVHVVRPHVTYYFSSAAIFVAWTWTRTRTHRYSHDKTQHTDTQQIWESTKNIEVSCTMWVWHTDTYPTWHVSAFKVSVLSRLPFLECVDENSDPVSTFKEK